MSHEPTASNSLGIIGVELYRLHVGTASVINLIFAAVPTDWKWIVWYSFLDDASLSEDFQSRWTGEGSRAADIYGRGSGRTNHEFHRVFLHTTKAMRVDGLTGDGKDKAAAVMFARNSLKKGHVLVDIDIERADGCLHLRRLHLDGAIPREFDAQNTRGTVYRWTKAQIFKKQDLANPPNGSELQLA
jgi:hypothetical protein